MPQFQIDCLMAVRRYLPEIAKQLKIANMLKLLELKKSDIGNSPLLEDIEKELDD